MARWACRTSCSRRRRRSRQAGVGRRTTGWSRSSSCTTSRATPQLPRRAHSPGRRCRLDLPAVRSRHRGHGVRRRLRGERRPAASRLLLARRFSLRRAAGARDDRQWSAEPWHASSPRGGGGAAAAEAVLAAFDRSVAAVQAGLSRSIAEARSEEGARAISGHRGSLRVTSGHLGVKARSELEEELERALGGKRGERRGERRPARTPPPRRADCLK